MTVQPQSLAALSSEAACARAPRPSFGERLAEVLSWRSPGSALVKLDEDLSFDRIHRASIGTEPAALFFGHKRATAGHLLDEAALFAYHSDIEWCVITNCLETRIVNSHWVTGENWFSLPPISPSEIADHKVLRSLTPEGLRAGVPEERALKEGTYERLLEPVDDSLFDVLDRWRIQFLRHSKSLDESHLHHLIVQLFILRAIEDRNASPGLPPLETILRNDDPLRRLAELFALSREVVQSELFADPPPLELDPLLLKGLITDLYTPRHLPSSNARYNFAWITSDILGRAYEKYLSSVLIPRAVVSDQLRLWEQPSREVEKVTRRKRFGVYYTPDFIVRFLVDRTFTSLLRDREFSVKQMPRIGDFSCGSGSFLRAALDALLARARQVDDTRNWGKEVIEQSRIFGVDIDSRATELARLSIWLRLTEEPDPLPLPELKAVIVTADALAEGPVVEADAFDIVLGNPPFLATGRVPPRRDLENRFQTARGRFDYSYLFVELSVAALREGGILGLVVPNRLFRNRDAALIRELLAEKTDLETLVDFGATEVFAGVSAYVGLLMAQKGKTSPRPTFRYIRVRDLGNRFRAADLAEAGRSEDLLANQKLVAFNVASHPSSAPWVFLSPQAKRLRVRLDNVSDPLRSLAGVRQGIKTGANDILIAELVANSQRGLITIQNGLGESAVVEGDFCRPVIFGSEIERFRYVETGRIIIYPYRSGRLVPVAILRRDAPHLVRYLERYRDILEARSSLSESPSKKWYELIRPREEAWLAAPKLLMRDLATRPEFAFDESGATFLVGGTAVVPSDPRDSLVLLSWLNSVFGAWYLSKVTPAFQSGFRKYEVQHLEEVPVPRALLDESANREKIEALALRILSHDARDEAGDRAKLEEELDSLLSTFLEIELPDLV